MSSLIESLSKLGRPCTNSGIFNQCSISQILSMMAQVAAIVGQSDRGYTLIAAITGAIVGSGVQANA